MPAYLGTRILGGVGKRKSGEGLCDLLGIESDRKERLSKFPDKKLQMRLRGRNLRSSRRGVGLSSVG